MDICSSVGLHSQVLANNHKIIKKKQQISRLGPHDFCSHAIMHRMEELNSVDFKLCFWEKEQRSSGEK